MAKKAAARERAQARIRSRGVVRRSWVSTLEMLKGL
jgi:hypothetical protein